MKKNLITLCLISVSSIAYSQVGISTPNPQGVLHVDGGKDNPTTGAPSAIQQSNDFIVTDSGHVEDGIITPNANLDIRPNPQSTSDPGTGFLGIGTTAVTAPSYEIFNSIWRQYRI